MQFFELGQKQKTINQHEDITSNDIAPGSDKAILTLSDGSAVVLDTAEKGRISGKDNVIKDNNGRLSYLASSSDPVQTATGYNTLTTPKGGKYEVLLSDGSRVWLNAASSLHYPALFSGGGRRVELTGEGYFEVKHDPSKPFIVNANGTEVQVLGTHFNINAYSDEPLNRVDLIRRICTG